MSFARELAPAVRVNTIEPGPILFLDEHGDAWRQQVLAKTPLAREGAGAHLAGGSAVDAERLHDRGQHPVDGTAVWPSSRVSAGVRRGRHLLLQGDGGETDLALLDHLACHQAGMQRQGHLAIMHLATAIELRQQLVEIGIDPGGGEVIALAAGQDVDVQLPVQHLAARIAAILAVGQLHGDEVCLELVRSQLALGDEQAVEEIMAGVHPDRLGLDHRAQLQAAKVHEQLADRLTDVLGGQDSIQCYTDRTCHRSLDGAHLKFIHSSRLSG